MRCSGPLPYFYCGDYVTANALADELVALADEKGAFFWKAFGMMNQGRLFAVTGKASDAVPMITSGFKLRSSNREKNLRFDSMS
jgi:hypothetical protein